MYDWINRIHHCLIEPIYYIHVIGILQWIRLEQDAFYTGAIIAMSMCVFVFLVTFVFQYLQQDESFELFSSQNITFDKSTLGSMYVWDYSYSNIYDIRIGQKYIHEVLSLLFVNAVGIICLATLTIVRNTIGTSSRYCRKSSWKLCIANFNIPFLITHMTYMNNR